MATRRTHSVIITDICSPHSPCVNEPDNALGLGGAKALVPALKQMTHMTELDLSGKSRMASVHVG